MSKPPFRVTLLIWLVLTFTAWNVLRAWTAVAWRGTLKEFSPQPSPVIIALSSVIWVIIGLILLWSIWKNKTWYTKLLLGTASVYTIWYWSERLIWQNPQPNWLFTVIVNLVIITLILSTTKSLAREAYERNIEN